MASIASLDAKKNMLKASLPVTATIESPVPVTVYCPVIFRSASTFNYKKTTASKKFIGKYHIT